MSVTSDALLRQSELLGQVRKFFSVRGFTEVSTPTVDAEIIPELHIDPYEVAGIGYLQASPEMHLKRLLCGSSGPIFEVAKCFRRGELGPLHRSEFTMVEWYRPGDDMLRGIELLDAFTQSTLDAKPAKRISYREAFIEHIGVDPHTAPATELQRVAKDDETDRDELLNLLLAKYVEPKLGVDQPQILYHYPASQSALATVSTDALGTDVAQRFELYYRGIELANGYHELTDATELRRRLSGVNNQRAADGRPTLPLPERLLAEMESPGLPPCAGVALGFDRLWMLAMGANSLDEISRY